MEAETSEKADASDPNADPSPVVYQLVRVDDDGRLVPATDEDLVVENLLEEEKAEQNGPSTEQRMEDCKTQGLSLERNEPSLEENQKIPLESVSSIGEENIKKEETVRSTSPSNPKDINPSRSPGNSISGDVSKIDSPVPDAGSSTKPNFSKLRGEVCLDKLSVDELRETFRATFGRESSVKDKEWLKRRISMALSNSCDFSATNFIIKNIDNIEKVGVEFSQTGACSSSYIGVAKKAPRDRSDGYANQAKIHSNVNDLVLGARTTAIMDQDFVAEDSMLEGRAAKRIRKPTKRYIEQLSEAESGGDSGGRLVEKRSEPEQPSGARVRSMQSVMSSGGTNVTRKDSMGGSGGMVPYVWRARRRSRPRVNLMPFMNQPLEVSSEMKMVKETIAAPEFLSENETEVLKVRMSPTCAQQPLTSASEESELSLGGNTMELDKGADLSQWDPCDENSDDYTGSTPSGTGRRKHHRPWSLTEVVKLVEGVSQHGIGRWSEIKRLVFASSTYRTSVDLKDKWRNLIRASSMQLSGESNPRKHHASTPIPASILVRVRELAEEHGQVTPVPKLPPSKLTKQTMEGFL